VKKIKAKTEMEYYLNIFGPNTMARDIAVILLSFSCLVTITRNPDRYFNKL